MKPTLLILALLAAALSPGCDREKNKNQSTPSQQDSGSAAGSAAGSSIPKVGVPFFTKETYKPVIGTRGGRIVRDTPGEPKSFNPITSGESSTTEYTMFIFEGLTGLDPST